MTEKPTATLNEFQQRALRIGCAYIDELLGDVEQVLNAAQSKSVFPKYINDITPVQRKTIEDYIARIRAQLLRVLAGQSIEIDKPRITASHAIHTTLTFVEINVEELSPSRMRGYGEVSEAGVADLNGIMQELQSIVTQLQRYLRQRGGPDIGERLKQLEAKGGDVALLRTIEDIVTRRGLVEFRSTLMMLLERLEDKSFEIAIFGRVSSGKSSLLNHVIGADILPVGVTPITAVPTRVSFGEKPEVIVQIEGSGIQRLDISQLPSFVDERQNPGNQKRVARLIVRYPSERLRKGTIFVDTPGLGSLATSGAAETMAYLPRCDVGVVLIDAGSTLTPEDLKIVETLYNAGIPATVVLSKADLLADSDRERVREYVRAHVHSEIGIEVDVRPVSILPTHASLLDAWFNQDIASLYSREQQLRQESIHRKTLALRESVLAALESELRPGRASQAAPELMETEARLRRAAGILQSTEPEIRKLLDQVPGLGRSVVRKAAEVAAERWENEHDVDLGDVLVTTAAHAMTEIGSSVREKLVDVVASLRREAAEAAKVLPNSAAIPQEELFADREMPVFHMNREHIVVSKPSLAGFLGHTAQVRHASKELEQFRPSLDAALTSYAAVLRGWADRSLKSIDQRFNQYADRYRAQLDRILSGTKRSDEERETVRKDIKVLRDIVEVCSR